MLKQRRFLMPAAVFTFSMLLVACAPDRDEEQVDSESIDGENGGGEPEQPESLHMWINDDDDQIAAIETIAERYTEETGIEVELTTMSMFEQGENMALDGPAGSGPDIYFVPHDHTGNLAVQNLIEPIELDPEDEDRFTDESLQGMTYEGELYGVPFVSETYGLLYNEELVPEAPKTMEELEKIAEELTDTANDEYGFLAETSEMYFSYPFIAGYGGYIFGETEDGYNPDDIGLNNEGAIEGAEKIKNWHDNDWIPSTIDPEIQDGLFTEGNVGVSLTGPWNIPSYAAGIGEENLSSAALPELSNGEVAPSLIGFKSWVMSPYSEHQYWAQDLMLFMTEDENNMHYYREAGEMPAVEELLEDPEIADDELMQGFAEQTLNGEPMPNIPEIDQVWEASEDALQFISEGEDPEEVFDEAVDQIYENIEMMGN
ncbi:arabinogalactan oligomer/maltooligosaccharide transport system substrate-binding protein [Geomicrobium halophilum]|uniref:Maltodextrin-binding protein n=1 Tax=Geomicrobium halophilum TaxID=549000 RepID=A0A841PUQ0_9BACL|nr:extracellular solute-binding protein [Geomicrobium halophilum]MBB6450031.1 arabinogalactan oligomer/maltooligosaccharide transport system substrate-binding protein [Geomicrobium halophilum]